MKTLYIVLAVGAVVSGILGGYLTETTFSLLWAVLGPICLLGVILLLGRFFYIQDKKKKASGELTPEIRGVFDRMFGNEPVGGNRQCMMCGGSRGPEDGHACRSCVELMKQIGNLNIFGCGGCGAGFVAETKIQVYDFKIGGALRTLCACCQEYLKGRAGSDQVMPPMQPGYDDEGQNLNKKLLGHSLISKLNGRTKKQQAMILNLVKNKAKRTNKPLPSPIFLEELNNEKLESLGASGKESKSSVELMTPEEIHDFGIEVVSKYIKKDGYLIRSINTKLNEYPQIKATKDGELVFVIVRTSWYPGKGKLSSGEINEFIQLAKENDAIGCFASVGIANSEGENSQEMSKPVRRAGFYVSFSGLANLEDLIPS